MKCDTTIFRTPCCHDAEYRVSGYIFGRRDVCGRCLSWWEAMAEQAGIRISVERLTEYEKDGHTAS